MKKFGFQDLEIYQLSKDLVIDTYRINNEFPVKERYALVLQMNRACISIPSNIAEGYSRAGVKEKSHFLNIAYGSLMELVCQYEISGDLNYIDDEQLEKIIIIAHNLAVKISNFRKYICNNKSNE